MSSRSWRRMSTLLMRFVSLVLHVLRKAMEEYRKLTTRSQVLLVCGGALLFVIAISPRKNSGATEQDDSRLKIITWNVAAINNNPFEYWLTLKDDPKYDEMMTSVEAFVTNPIPRKDQLVSALFTEEMFNKLAEKMSALQFTDIEKVRELYVNDWSKRRVVSDFLKDPIIGKKRLVSMPDRITNTIITSKGKFFRPTPINCYDGPRFASISSWYDQWLKYMFETKVTEDGKVPAQLLEKIPSAKYPALTPDEEAISIPLQTLVIGIFDGIQVRMLNQIAGANEWQNLRERICTNLNRKKSEKTLRILRTSYGDANIMFLQETAASFIESAKEDLGSFYHVISPAKLGANDQNSLILLYKSVFDLSTLKEHTSDVLAILKQSKSPVVAGDLLVISVVDNKGRKYFLASFHGDTNGLATIPVVKAVRQVFKEQREGDAERFLFGMDANTYEKVENKAEYQDVMDFVSFYTEQEGLLSCWGPVVNPKRHTTRNARTYMQPQLSKAAAKSEVETKGDANPKDFILFEPSIFDVALVARDNTGTGGYVEGMVFPTLEFPSDHAIVRVVLEEKISSS